MQQELHVFDGGCVGGHRFSPLVVSGQAQWSRVVQSSDCFNLAQTEGTALGGGILSRGCENRLSFKQQGLKLGNGGIKFDALRLHLRQPLPRQIKGCLLYTSRCV